MTSPLLEVGQPVLVARAANDTPWRMTVDLVQDRRITLAALEDEHLPGEWSQLGALHLTCLGRFSVYEIDVDVVRSGDTRLVVGVPLDESAVQRRAYARVLRHVPVSCALLDIETCAWTTFDGEVRDLGGGGCSVLADTTPPTGSTVVISFALDDDDAPFAAVGRVLPREALPTIGKPLTRVEFTLIREPDRDRIMRFVLLSLSRRRPAEARPV